MDVFAVVVGPHLLFVGLSLVVVTSFSLLVVFLLIAAGVLANPSFGFDWITLSGAGRPTLRLRLALKAVPSRPSCCRQRVWSV